MNKINALKTMIYNEINPILNDLDCTLYYGICNAENRQGIYAIYQVYNITENDSTGQFRDDVYIQIAVYINVDNYVAATSLEADNIIEILRNALKENNITTTINDVAYTLCCSLPEMITPALFNNEKHEWMSLLRIKALFTNTK